MARSDTIGRCTKRTDPPRAETTTSNVRVRQSGPVAYVRLDRPHVRNAFNSDVVNELARWAASARENRSIRVAVMSGEGKAFCAGADIEWLAATMSYSHEQYRDDARALQELLNALDTLPFPLIARIHGAAVAGGVGLAAVCDVAVAAEDAVFGISETKIGIVPAIISPYVIAKIGPSAARSLVLTGMKFSAGRAFELGLVHAVVPADALDDAVDKFVAEILTSGPEAVAVAKAMIRQVTGLSPEQAASITADIIAERRSSAEGQAGMRAFLAKRRAPWID
jgi:methylglutaconyl-CoA hydratase